ncbi:MAG TPA: YifB family Mg chelatase-like AAA ATPase [Epulopiscium sp.]|nr:YifB family Mg chelatase-like AAA ATPase [Candidatus Epulonipiscium sp.]
MYCKLTSCALKGVDGLIVTVEVDISNGLPSFDLVGLPDSSVRESKERVRSAIKNSGYPFPVKRITVNLAPADYKKEGAYYDLPIALGILCCIGVVEQDALDSHMIVGELSLDGSVQSVNGILPIACTAKDAILKQCLVPISNASESALVKGIDTIGISSLKEAIFHLTGENPCLPVKFNTNNHPKDSGTTLDFRDVKGQEEVKRALEIAGAGNHNLLMIGPPGSGKTMMAHRLPSILPDLSFEESLQVTKIYSISGKLNNKSHVITKRPFRSPHHTTTPSALIGGGKIPKPGEISLAHQGVLFLDEFLEFNKNVLQTLRQPLESKDVTISRVNSSLTFPANFMLIASTNPCPCGFYPDDTKCQCSSQSVRQYLRKLSGPLLDRIDIHIETRAIAYDQLTSSSSESSNDIAVRVKNAIKIQTNRYKKESIMYNSELQPPLIEKYCPLGSAQKDLLKKAFHTLNLSARSYHKIIKIARTIADLDDSDTIELFHLTEAIQYRVLDRTFNL